MNNTIQEDYRAVNCLEWVALADVKWATYIITVQTAYRRKLGKGRQGSLGMPRCFEFVPVCGMMIACVCKYLITCWNIFSWLEECCGAAVI